MRTMECMYPQMRKIRMAVIKKDETIKRAAESCKEVMLEIANLDILAA